MANGLGLDELLPLMAQRKRERDVGVRRQEREAKATELYQTIYGGEGTREEKIRAMAQGATMGINFPQSVLKEPQKAKGLFDLFEVEEPLRRAYELGNMTLDQVLDHQAKLGGDNGLTLEKLQEMYKLDPSLAQGEFETPEKLSNALDVLKLTGSKMFRRIYGIKDPPKESALSEKRRAVKSIIGDRNIKELLEDPRALAELEVTGVSQPELLAMFGVDRKAIIDAQTAITTELAQTDPLAKFDFGGLLAKWTAGDTEGINKETLRLLDKYYEKETGALKPGAVIERADELMELALERAMGGKPAKDLPEQFKPYILNILNQGLTKKEARKLYEAEKLDPSIQLDITDEEFEKILEYIDE